MRYVLVDLDGASRDYFQTREAAREALKEIEAEAPGTAAELYIVTYNGDVQQGAPERGDELLATQVVLTRKLDWSGNAESDDCATETLVAGASR